MGHPGAGAPSCGPRVAKSASPDSRLGDGAVEQGAEASVQLLVDSGPRLFPGCPQAPLPACHPKAASRDRLGQTLVLRWGQDPWAEEQPSGLWEGLRGRGAPQATVSLPVAWRSPLLPGTLPAQPWGEAPGPRAAPSPEGGPHPWGGPQPPPPAAFLPRHSPFLPLVTVGLKLGQELFQPSRSPRRARERDTGQAGDGGCGGMGGASSRVPHRLRTLRPPPQLPAHLSATPSSRDILSNRQLPPHS